MPNPLDYLSEKPKGVSSTNYVQGELRYHAKSVASEVNNCVFKLRKEYNQRQLNKKSKDVGTQSELAMAVIRKRQEEAKARFDRFEAESVERDTREISAALDRIEIDDADVHGDSIGAHDSVEITRNDRERRLDEEQMGSEVLEATMIVIQSHVDELIHDIPGLAALKFNSQNISVTAKKNKEFLGEGRLKIEGELKELIRVSEQLKDIHGNEYRLPYNDYMIEQKKNELFIIEYLSKTMELMIDPSAAIHQENRNELNETIARLTEAQMLFENVNEQMLDYSNDAKLSERLLLDLIPDNINARQDRDTNRLQERVNTIAFEQLFQLFSQNENEAMGVTIDRANVELDLLENERDINIKRVWRDDTLSDPEKEKKEQALWDECNKVIVAKQNELDQLVNTTKKEVLNHEKTLIGIRIDLEALVVNNFPGNVELKDKLLAKHTSVSGGDVAPVMLNAIEEMLDSDVLNDSDRDKLLLYQAKIKNVYSRLEIILDENSEVLFSNDVSVNMDRVNQITKINLERNIFKESARAESSAALKSRSIAFEEIVTNVVQQLDDAGMIDNLTDEQYQRILAELVSNIKKVMDDHRSGISEMALIEGGLDCRIHRIDAARKIAVLGNFAEIAMGNYCFAPMEYSEVSKAVLAHLLPQDAMQTIEVSEENKIHVFDNIIMNNPDSRHFKNLRHKNHASYEAIRNQIINDIIPDKFTRHLTNQNDVNNVLDEIAVIISNELTELLSKSTPGDGVTKLPDQVVDNITKKIEERLKTYLSPDPEQLSELLEASQDVCLDVFDEFDVRPLTDKQQEMLDSDVVSIRSAEKLGATSATTIDLPGSHLRNSSLSDTASISSEGMSSITTEGLGQNNIDTSRAVTAYEYELTARACQGMNTHKQNHEMASEERIDIIQNVMSEIRSKILKK